MKKRIWITLAVLMGILLFLCGVFALQVDDWSRDFVQNRAETSTDASNPALRPIQADIQPIPMAQVIEKAVNDLKGWQTESRNVSERRVEFNLTRTSRLFRFVDDVTVLIDQTPGGCTINATSQSRVGKGDLGQNPRNISELFAAIRVQLDAK